MISLVLATLLPVAMTVPDNGARSHEEEIKLFADLAALAEMVSTSCPDVLINRSLMSALGEQMHIRPMDGPAVREQARETTKMVTKAIADAPSPQAWCDAIYGRYGPDGKVLPKLMLR